MNGSWMFVLFSDSFVLFPILIDGVVGDSLKWSRTDIPRYEREGVLSVRPLRRLVERNKLLHLINYVIF
jgi:hypothetical protein